MNRSIKKYYLWDLVFNIVCTVIIFSIAKMNEAGGNSLGYVLIGFPILGIASLFYLIIITIIFKRRLKENFTLFLLLVSINILEILLLGYLAW